MGARAFVAVTSAVVSIAMVTFFSAVQAAPFINVVVNNSSLETGNVLRVGLTVNNPLEPVTGDFYFGVIHPDGINATFIVSLNPVTGVVRRLDDPRTFPPLVAGIALATGFSLSNPDFFVYTVGTAEPEGNYRFFAGFTAPAAFANGGVANVLSYREVRVGLSHSPGGCGVTRRC